MRYFLMTLVMLMGFAVGGCEKALFPDKYPRTQFERYDRAHGRFTPSAQTGPYGDERPALRERLSPYTY